MFLLLFGIAFAAVLVWWVQYDPMTPAELAVLVALDLILLVLSVIFLRMGKVCRVEVDGERIRVYSRFGVPAEFSVRDVADVSRSIGWIVLYDREWKTLAKLDPRFGSFGGAGEQTCVLWGKNVKIIHREVSNFD